MLYHFRKVVNVENEVSERILRYCKEMERYGFNIDVSQVLEAVMDEWERAKIHLDKRKEWV